MSGPLEGVRILDFSRFIAGPYCGALLGDLGADVIRIEKVAGGEDRYITPVSEDGIGASYLQMNRNKKSITLNPRKERGKEIVRKLLRTADVVLVNMPPDALVELGLDYKTLRETKPDIILTSTTAFGEGGPYGNRVGFDGIAQVMSGAAYLAGSPGRPQRCVAPYVDFGTAMASTIGTLVAIMEHRRSGKGQEVGCDLLGTALNVFNMQLIEQAITGVGRVATENRSPTTAPTDIFRCTDGWIMIQVAGQPLWRRWIEMVGATEWLTDERFKDDLSRGENGEVVSARMAAWCAERTVSEALTACEEARIPCGPVYSPQQTLDDPHVRERNYFRPVTYPGVDKPVPIADTPFRLSGSDVRIRCRAPLLGEHTDEILNELGYTGPEIAELRELRVV
ncbi:CaiB/BaiF CoA transferase family protein [Oceanibacterium hippocampi]|uniref:Formyl-coenzyme A transferase n=1 Tax=Oceanibacterium hippocampi TaxID=745714 RepID=A0A1Y5TMJ8_9PROT|nr:CoA transferase [Oceanibacterium hippocampi]SLN67077.1 Formyl-coenzyme A transferase [Oceanibacterium hippocampi]